MVQSAGATQITTYHYDNLRTGWNRGETVLTPANVRHLRRLETVALDGLVNAQPLLVQGVAIAGGRHDVVYVATENDSVYAIAAATGQILARRSLGTPVPQSALPGACWANSTVVGIDSTPVIDPVTSTLYVMAYTRPGGQPTWTLHALDLGTLRDKTTAVDVQAKATLSDGSHWNFAAANERQRPALLEASGNIYAAFGSFCDINANLSRGWILGWKADSLRPLAANRLTNKLSQAPHDFFLSSIWMSGSGPAADPAGNVYFSTGNSDYSGKTYSPTNNLSESVVKMSPDLSKVLSYFSPGGGFSVQFLDRGDGDFGSGGVLLLPTQPGNLLLAVAAGKVGEMYLLDRRNLGGHHNVDRVVSTAYVAICWCSESYFTGVDGIGRIVSSGGSFNTAGVNNGNVLTVWKVQTSLVPLPIESQFELPGSAQDPGLFTAVSSHGTSNALIWAVGRPADSRPAHVRLYAFDPNRANGNTSGPVYSAVAGTWPFTVANANIVPVVANGRVYVASYKQLAIFGLAPPGAAQPEAPTAPLAAAAPPALPPLPAGQHEIFGTIKAIAGGDITLATREGKLLRVDAADAVRQHLSIVLLVGEPVIVSGSYDGSGALHAMSVQRAKPSPKGWPADR